MGRVAVAGVDGCRRGWLAVICAPAQEAQVHIFTRFADILATLPPDAVLAVDMPIGLPDRTGRGGRGPESLVRPLLGERQSSVFTIPARSAVYAVPDIDAAGGLYAAHRQASAIALTTSESPRAISIQAFGLFPKIRELDALLRNEPALRPRIYESHPEVAFWRLNGEQPMRLPKKIKGQVNPAGLEERRRLLCSHGFSGRLLDQALPAGAGRDDLLDAAALALIAARIADGVACPFPEPPLRDAFGLPIAIWT